MKVLITGADGFLGRNLAVKLGELAEVNVLGFTRRSSTQDLQRLAAAADFIFHLAGVNRPDDVAEFTAGNADLTVRLCNAVKASGRPVPIAYASSIQAEHDNPYGKSKLQAEQELGRLNAAMGNALHVFRLPNVFGKWCRPNYNSVVATFCYNIARELPIRVNDAATGLNLVYVDDLMASFAALLQETGKMQVEFPTVTPQYSITLGELAGQLRAFRESRVTLISERVGDGLPRALYATYVSYLPTAEFAYDVPVHGDPRGVFVEMLKTKDSGQFSYFTAHPGVTRGGHYHHSKTEKFLVIKGQAHFRFRQLVTGEFSEVFTSGERPRIVETIPGWAHDITNVGPDEMVVMLWANEIFDRERPDTIARRL